MTNFLIGMWLNRKKIVIEKKPHKMLNLIQNLKSVEKVIKIP